MVSIVHAARDIGRLRDISRVLVVHGFGEIVGQNENMYFGSAQGLQRPQAALPVDETNALLCANTEKRLLQPGPLDALCELFDAVCIEVGARLRADLD